MPDDVLTSALRRGKPVSAKRVRVLVDELAQLRAALALAHAAIDHARKWAAHDDALRRAINEYQEDV